MYVTLLERLIEPILLNKTCEVEIRELVENNHYNDLILMAQKSLISVLIGKKGNTIRALSTIIENKTYLYLENNTIKLVINDF